MNTRRSETEMRSEAEQLARLLRSGLEFRWPVPPPVSGPGPFPPGGSIRAFLTPYADTLNHQLPVRTKFWHRVLRRARSVVRAVITPWLCVQSHFNFAVINVVEQLEERIRALEEAERALRQAIEDRESTVRENR
jgi:hypothetical protein